MFIESIHNDIIKLVTSLKEKKNRDEKSLFVVEGFKQVSEIPKDWKIKFVIVTEKYKDFITDKKYITTEKIFKKISDTKTPQEILAVVEKKYVSYMLHSSLFWPSEQNHPQWADVYFMFDLNTGEIILQDDIFDASAENRQAVGVKIHDELVKFAGNEEDIFAEAGAELLNASFVFDDKGMTFFYQPYEVGPYMLGEPEVHLSKEWLEPYLKKDGILYDYWFKN